MKQAPHPNAGSSGVLRGVVQILEEHPEGLTTLEILERAIDRGTVRTDPREGPKTPYFRIKRAVESLLKVGFIRTAGLRELEDRSLNTYQIIPEAMDRALRHILRLALLRVEDRIRKLFPMSDTSRLIAAFEDVLKEDAERLGLSPFKPETEKPGVRGRKRRPIP